MPTTCKRPAIIRKSTYILSALLCATAAHAQNAVSDPIVTRAFQAEALAVNGQVTRLRDDRPWAISSGDVIPVQQILSTGQDGYARLQIAGGSTFEILGNSKVIFRQNVANPNDVMDIVTGRVRLQLKPKRGEQQRIFSPSAIITAHMPASLALAMMRTTPLGLMSLKGKCVSSMPGFPATKLYWCAPLMPFSCSATKPSRGALIVACSTGTRPAS